MGGITDSSLAAANAVSIENTQFKVSASVLPRKILVIGTYSTDKTDVSDNVPRQIFSDSDGGAKYGFGSMLHRLILQSFTGSQGVETWAIPQPEDVAAERATGDIVFTGTGTKAGNIYLYIAGLPVVFAIADGDDGDAIATKAVAAIALQKNLPVTAAVNGVTTNQVDFESKSGGPWGNNITLGFNLRTGEEFPVGVSAVVTDMASGAGTYAIQDALDALGTGDDQNENYFTDLIHGYGQDTTTLDALSVYNGIGNGKTGNYSELVIRPFRALNGDTVADTAGLAALLALSDLRKELDRTNGTIAVPGSPNHPEEIAAQAMGHMARINNLRAQDPYFDVALSGIIPGEKADRWTSNYDNRDNAVRNGISPTHIKSGSVVMQNVVTYYHPEAVPEENNGYRSMRNISLTQNITNAKKQNYSQEKWQNITIVADVSRVTNSNSQLKARDTNAVLGDELALARIFESLGWIFSADFTIDQFKKRSPFGRIDLRQNGTGFNIFSAYVYSGEGGIINTKIFFDTSLAVFIA